MNVIKIQSKWAMQVQEITIGWLWNVAAATIFILGMTLWVFIGMFTEVVGFSSIAILWLLAITSAVGVGIAVGYCAERAQDASKSGIREENDKKGSDIKIFKK